MDRGFISRRGHGFSSFVFVVCCAGNLFTWTLTGVWWAGIATRYGLDGPGIESRWGGGRDYPHPPTPSLGSTQRPIQYDCNLVSHFVRCVHLQCERPCDSCLGLISIFTSTLFNEDIALRLMFPPRGSFFHEEGWRVAHGCNWEPNDPAVGRYSFYKISLWTAQVVRFQRRRRELGRHDVGWTTEESWFVS
jgi:hypothetical protein